MNTPPNAWAGSDYKLAEQLGRAVQRKQQQEAKERKPPRRKR